MKGRSARLTLTILCAAAVISGCSAAPAKKIRPSVTEGNHRGVALSQGGEVKRALYSQLENWKAVRYRSGGLSKKGVDCSGLVYLTYRDRFGVKLPRTTKEQVRKGRRVSRKSLRPGDLVFFKTGFFTKHVGIYVDGGTFLHVSRSAGVTLSRLDNRYWSKRYWQSRRIGS